MGIAIAWASLVAASARAADPTPAQCIDANARAQLFRTSFNIGLAYYWGPS